MYIFHHQMTNIVMTLSFNNFNKYKLLNNIKSNNIKSNNIKSNNIKSNNIKSNNNYII
jgi:hypothetical protein